MKTIEIESIESLIECINRFENHYIFRGHANAEWSLESSLERAAGRKWSHVNAIKYEDFSLSQFQSKFHLYDNENIQPQTKLAWLSLMQHYGVPTRLIDFTESPYIALYFALEDYNPSSGNNMALYALDYRGIMKESISHIKNRDGKFNEDGNSIFSKRDSIFEEIVDRFSYEIAWVTEPTVLNKRLDLQAGSFLLSGNREAKIEAILDSEIYKPVDISKIIIPARFYSNIFALLRKMSITSKSIYGDLFGLARSIRTELKVYST